MAFNPEVFEITTRKLITKQVNKFAISRSSEGIFKVELLYPTRDSYKVQSVDRLSQEVSELRGVQIRLDHQEILRLQVEPVIDLRRSILINGARQYDYQSRIPEAYKSSSELVLIDSNEILAQNLCAREWLEQQLHRYWDIALKVAIK